MYANKGNQQTTIAGKKQVIIKVKKEVMHYSFFILYEHEIYRKWHFSTNKNKVNRLLPGLQLRVRNLFFLFLNQNICCGNSKEPSE